MKRLVGLAAIFCFCVFGVSPATRVTFTPYEDAKPILDSLAEIIPPELRDAAPEAREDVWNAWVSKRDAEIRSRLAQGDADSVVNFLMFGTSFTFAPRLTGAQLRAISAEAGGSNNMGAAATWQSLLEKRVHDLVRGMAAPGTNERLQFARKTLEHVGIRPIGSNGEQSARLYLLENVKRVLQEQSSFQQTLVAAKSLNDPTEEFAERSKLYKERGLSLDTSLPPNYALEIALKEMKSRGLLKPGNVKRIGIIGPGLDFTDKQEGFDFYPSQTVQPFAVMDSLLRLGLAKASEVEVDTLDLSPRILAHVAQSVRSAEKGRGYTIQLPKDPSRGWEAELVAYWRRFGDQIGTPVAPRPVPAALKGVTLRAVHVRPGLVQQMKTYDLNIVLQRVGFDETEKFDLLIATNILVYYDTFEQSLAMTNMAAMLKQRGYLLTNNLLLELPESRLKAEDYVSVPYSAKDADGDTIIHYKRLP